MWDWLRGWLQSAETQRLETISAYVDDALTPAARRRFEAELGRDVALQSEVAHLRQIKAGLRQLPRADVPRNFTLDPARYSRPARAPEVRLYPALRLATVVAGLLFMLAVVFTLLPGSAGQQVALLTAPSAAPASELAQEVDAGVPEEARVAAENYAAVTPPVEATGESAPGDFSIAAAQPTVPPEATPTPLPVSPAAPTANPEPAAPLPTQTSETPRLLGLGGLFGLLLIFTLLLRRRLTL